MVDLELPRGSDRTDIAGLIGDNWPSGVMCCPGVKVWNRRGESYPPDPPSSDRLRDELLVGVGDAPRRDGGVAIGWDSGLEGEAGCRGIVPGK